MGLFKDVEPILLQGLFGATGPGLSHKNALAAWKPGRGTLTPMALRLHQVIHERWQAAGKRNPSEQNWRFTLQTAMSEHNPSREKTLEKRIARLAEGGLLQKDAWANQIPVASGLFGPDADKKAAVDLGFRRATGHFELIELKTDAGSGHALYAAMELFLYGLLYIYTRRSIQGAPAGSVLAATRIDLVVLAPAPYYAGNDGRLLNALASELSAAFGVGPAISLRFEAFPNWFGWPCDDQRLVEAIRSGGRW